MDPARRAAHAWGTGHDDVFGLHRQGAPPDWAVEGFDPDYPARTDTFVISHAAQAAATRGFGSELVTYAMWRLHDESTAVLDALVERARRHLPARCGWSVPGVGCQQRCRI